MKVMRKALILAKLEVTYGTDAVPTAAANAILVRNMSVQPVTGEFVPRDVIRPYLGGDEQLPAAIYATANFEVELAGSGTAGTAPKFNGLLRACGLSETVTASTDVKYAPTSSAYESTTIYYYLDGLLHKLTGARGTVVFALNAKQIPVAQFAFTGLCLPVTDAALPASPDFSGFRTPQVVNYVNTAAWSLHGFTGACEALSIDLGNTVGYRNLIGLETVELTDRNTTGSATLELPPIATKDFPGIIRNGTTGALSITHGTVAGNKVTFDAPKVQLNNPQYQDSEGSVFLQASLSLVPDAGNDELVITFL
ncbi:Phage tail protein [Cupriavidus oxalaticus]|uniref:phage tail tube protein n=1 Tax=Cupriavidus oxalaticus TaxID=96344 RepID=UPI003F7400B5